MSSLQVLTFLCELPFLLPACLLHRDPRRRVRDLTHRVGSLLESRDVFLQWGKMGTPLTPRLVDSVNGLNGCVTVQFVGPTLTGEGPGHPCAPVLHYPSLYPETSIGPLPVTEGNDCPFRPQRRRAAEYSRPPLLSPLSPHPLYPRWRRRTVGGGHSGTLQ